MSSLIGDIKNRADLLNHLVSLRAAAVYDLFGQTCLHEFFKLWHSGRADPDSLHVTLPEGRMSLRELSERLEQCGPRALVETKRNANRFLTRNLLKEGFRITQSFCKAHGHSAQMISEPWYQFARMLVNCLSHDFRLQFPQDEKQLPVSYGHYVIDKSMDGRILRIPLQVLAELSDHVIDFVRMRLP